MTLGGKATPANRVRGLRYGVLKSPTDSYVTIASQLMVPSDFSGAPVRTLDLKFVQFNGPIDTSIGNLVL